MKINKEDIVKAANNNLENNFNCSEIIDLLVQSKKHKKNKEYLQSIELLEQAKLKIA